jgi:hypothetical protein
MLGRTLHIVLLISDMLASSRGDIPHYASQNFNDTVTDLY